MIAPSPAVRAPTAADSRATDLARPFEGAGLERAYWLTPSHTRAYAATRHSLHVGGVYDVAPFDARHEINGGGGDFGGPVGEPVAGAVSLARCSGDGKHVFKMLHLLAPGSPLPPPPLALPAHCVFGLTSAAELSTAHTLWLAEGEASPSPAFVAAGGGAAGCSRSGQTGVQRAGERVSDALRRKPELRRWVTATAMALVQTSKAKTAAARHPLVKAGHLAIVGTALKVFRAERFLPVAVLPLRDDAGFSSAIPVGLPDGMTEETTARRRAWASRKQPQLRWMLLRIDELLPAGEPRVVLDVGGGRGDLAVLLGTHRPHWRTVAIDVHPPSVAGGRDAVAAAGVGDRAQVLLLDAEDLLAGGDKGARAKAAVGHFDAVVGLHCCGGLSETAVRTATAHSWLAACAPPSMGWRPAHCLNGLAADGASLAGSHERGLLPPLCLTRWLPLLVVAVGDCDGVQGAVLRVHVLLLLPCPPVSATTPRGLGVAGTL